MSLRQHFAAFILGVPVDQLTADNLAEVDGMLEPDEQPAMDERKLYAVVRGTDLLECGPDELDALNYARRVAGVVAELPIVADFRSPSTPDAVTAWMKSATRGAELHTCELRWQMGPEGFGHAGKPSGPIEIEWVEAEPGRLTVVYQTVRP